MKNLVVVVVMGGTILNLNAWIEKWEKNCEDNPYIFMNSSNLSERAHCRLFWGVGEEINILIKAKNKYMLLSPTNESDNAGWRASWDKYKKTDPWKIIKKQTEDQIPAEFKVFCETKSKETIYDIDNNEYKQVVDYCTRDKTIKDVLNESKIKLLADNNATEIWKSRFNNYKSLTIGARFHKDITAGDQNEGYIRLQKACKEAIELKTTIDNYKSILSSVKEYCKE